MNYNNTKKKMYYFCSIENYCTFMQSITCCKRV